MQIVGVIERAGGQSALARELGIKHTAIIGWRKAGRIPVKRAQQINAAYGIALHELRPDVWPVPAEQAA